tara:strand:+ start:5675 stop:5821 length:147 start_codon:yes stop_codon:yes gene_type:complete
MTIRALAKAIKNINIYIIGRINAEPTSLMKNSLNIVVKGLGELEFLIA